MANQLPFRQVHLDFHTSELIPDVGSDFNAASFQEALKRGNVDSITLFAKCHHGWSYYPTSVGTAHPGLVRADLLGEQIAACREIGVAAPVYITVQWDELTARERPEWRVMKADGGAGQEQLQAVWHPLCLSNAELVDRIIAQAREVIEKYHPVGLFFDILLPWECVCPNCVARMKAAGRDPSIKADRLTNHRELILAYYQRVSTAVREADPACRIFHNSGHIAKGERERWRWFSHLELESLPTGGWGWDHFPLSARYAATLGLEYLGMSGKFHTMWGEFGGYKTSASLEYECASMVAQGARCSIGDQLHPLGSMDLPTYERLGVAYRRVEKIEAYARGARPVSDVAMLSVEAAEAFRRANGERGASKVSAHGGSDADAGAARVLLEGHYMFDVIDAEEDFAKYASLILPDEVTLDAALAEKIKTYIGGGGAVLVSGSSGMNAEASRFLIDVGAEYDGTESPWKPDYIEALPAFRNDGRLIESPFVMYERARMVKARDAEILAAVHEPYFNRSWDAFCSHQHAPARKERSDRYDAVIRKGRVVYFSHPIFTAYKRTGQPLYRDLVLAALSAVCPRRGVRADLPSSGRLTLMRQDAERRTVLHLLFAQPSLRGSSSPMSGQPLEIVEDTVSLFDISCSVAIASRPSRVRAVMAETDLAFDWNDGLVTFTVPRVHIHEAVAIFD